MNQQISSRIRIGTIIVLLASAVVITSFFLPWTSLVLVLAQHQGLILWTNTGLEIAGEGISDKYSSLSWLYFITPMTVFGCFAFGLLSLKYKSSHLHVAQIILAVFGLFPFALMVIEFKIVNHSVWLGSIIVVSRYGIWLAILGLIGILIGALINLRQKQ